MEVYIYQAALLCVDCGEARREELDAEGKRPADVENESSFDSDDYPKGPEEAGESDSPSHCNDCNCFLQSDLTAEGVDYLVGLVEGVLTGREACGNVMAEWCNHYEPDRINLKLIAETGTTICEIVDHIQSLEVALASSREREKKLEKLLARRHPRRPRRPRRLQRNQRAST